MELDFLVIYSFDKYQDFDIVLLDYMFHFEKRDIK